MTSRRTISIALAAVGLLVAAVIVVLITRASTEEHSMSEAETARKAEDPGLASGDAGEVLGVVVPEESVLIASRVAGRIIKLEVKLGDTVSEGMLLAKLHEGDLQERIAYAKVAVAKAKSGKHKANLAYEDAVAKSNRAKKLQEAGDISKEAYETAKAKADIAKVELGAATSSVGLAAAELAQLEKALEETEIRAPFDGTVALVYESAGNVVTVGAPLLKVNSAGLMVRFAGPPKFMNSLFTGAKVSLVEDLTMSEGGAAAEAKTQKAVSEAIVQRIAPDIDPASELIIAEADIDDGALGKSLMRAGTVVNIWPVDNSVPLQQ